MRESCTYGSVRGALQQWASLPQPIDEDSEQDQYAMRDSRHVQRPAAEVGAA